MPNDQNVAGPVQFHSGLNDGVLALLGTAILLSSAVFWSVHLSGAEKTDFSMTYVAARLIHQGDGARLYDTVVQQRLRDSIFAHPGPLLFEHPPLEAFLLSPMAALPFRSVYKVWGLFNASLWLLCIIFLRPYLPWPRDLLGYIFLWLFSAPMAVALYQGQSSIILMALFAAAFVLLTKERDLLAGFALGFGLLKFQFVLPFAFIFLLRRRWRLIAGFAISFLMFVVLCITAVGLAGMKGYVHLLMAIMSHPRSAAYGPAVDMPTIHGFLFALLGQRFSQTSIIGLSLSISILLLGWLAAMWNSRPEASTQLWFAAAVAAVLLSSSHMFTQDFSPLTTGMFLSAAFLDRLPFQLRVPLAGVLVLLWAFPIYLLCIAWHCLYLMCPVLLLFVYLTVHVARSPSKQALSAPGYINA